jgi:2-methylcitrate dehydratase PrpD
MKDLEGTLAQYVATSDAASLSLEAASAAKAAILDTIGVAVRGSVEALPRAVASSAAEDGGSPRATIWGREGSRVPAHQAALVNGTSAHAIEMDDRMPAWSLHPGCFVVPAALAAVESAGGSGNDLIAAVAAGYGVGIVVGRSVKVRPGFHESAHKGTWCAVGAAARGSGLDAAQTRDAFGIAGSMASATGAYGDDARAAPLKALHGGLGARNGVMAADFARRGVPGPASSLTGRRGYFAVFGDGTRAPDMTGIDQALLFRETKPYAAWGGGHLVIDALARIRAEKGLPIEHIDEILVEGSAYLVANHDDASPKSPESARFSAPFLAAITLADGPDALMDPGIWTPELLERDEIVSLATKVRMVIDSGLDERARAAGGYGHVRVTVVCRSTSHTLEVSASRGTLEWPMTFDDISAKFFALAIPVIGRARAEGVKEAVMNLEKLSSVGSLSDTLQGISSDRDN